MLENSSWAEALLALSHLTGDERHSDRAAHALKIFESVVPGKSYLGGHASRRMEEDEEALFLPAGAAWGRAQGPADPRAGAPGPGRRPVQFGLSPTAPVGVAGLRSPPDRPAFGFGA